MRKSLSTAYTLIECLVVIAIVLTITTISIPSLTRLNAKLQKNESQQQLISLLAMARTVAIQRGKTVTYCGSNSNITCDTNRATTHLLFQDNNQNLIAEPSEIIRAEPFERSGDKFQLNVSAKRQSLRFRADGTAIDWGSITLCPADAEPSRAIHLVINPGGRVRSGSDNSSDGIPENSQGTNISCSE